MATRVGVKAGARMALAACIACLPASALSLGLGELRMLSFLNEPLAAEVVLLDVRDLMVDDIRIRLAEVEDFDRLGVDRSYFLTSIRFDVDMDTAAGQAVIRLSTEEPVLEPYLDLIIEARWPSGRALREYTVLVDPPAFRPEMITVSAVESVRGARSDGPDTDLRATSGEAAQAPEQGAAAGRQSGLAPGEMPQRAFSDGTTETPEAGGYYMVRRDDTLWEIAYAARSDDITTQQAMLDIQRVNPDAFADGNINRIKAGYIIYLPRPGEVDSDDLAAALDQVRAQNQAFREGRRLPGGPAAATLRVSADTPAPDFSPVEVIEDAVAAASAADARAVDAETPAPGVGSEALAEARAAAAASDAANSELAAQLEVMSRRLDALEKIVSLRDEQIARLELELREARETAAGAVTSDATVVPGTEPSRTVSWGVPWLLLGGGVLALVLALTLALRRRWVSAGSALPSGPRRAAPEEDVFAGVSLRKETISEAGAGTRAAVSIGDTDAVMDTLSPDETGLAPALFEEEDVFDRGGSRGYGERRNDDYIDEGAASDALAEADIYIAYGRYLQAIELLNTAIANEPDNSAYRLKLIELYVDMGEDDNAATQLEVLCARGDASAIARGRALVGATALTDAAPARAGGDVPGRAEDAAANGGGATTELAPDRSPEVRPDRLTVRDAGRYHDTYRDEPMELDQLEIEDDPDSGGAGDEALLDLEQGEDELDLTDALAEFRNAGRDAPDGDDTNGDFMIADDADQMATKLDLARAYFDMGDSQSARGILEEVAEAGSDEQQQEARELLLRID